MGSNGDADNDAHTRFVLERNRKAGGLTAMCHDGHSCLMKTMAHPPGKPDYWLVKQKEVAAHYKPTVEYYRAECGGRLGMPRTEQAVQILNSLKDHGELPRPDEMAGLEEEIEHLQRVIAGGGGRGGGPARGATGDERRAVAAAVAAEMAASDGPGREREEECEEASEEEGREGRASAARGHLGGPRVGLARRLRASRRRRGGGGGHLCILGVLSERS